jgi:hypothetical protein
VPKDFFSFVNLDLVDDEICEKMIDHISSLSLNKIMKEKFSSYIQKQPLTEDNIIKNFKRNSAYVKFLPDDVFTEELCIKLITIYKLSYIYYLGDKCTHFSRIFFEFLMKTKIGCLSYLPDHFVDKQMYDLVVEYVPSQYIVGDSRFSQFLTYEKCKEGVERGARIDYIPDHLMTDELRRLYKENYCRMIDDN